MPFSSGSVDAAEIERFERLGEKWWDPDGPMRPLHKLNPARVDWIADTLALSLPGVAQNGLKGLKILDIGCGAGLLCEALSRLGASVTAIDPSIANIEIARNHAAKSGLEIQYQAVTAEAVAADGARFDVVCALEVVEHVVDPATFIATACELVRPGGLLFAATLNRTLKSFGLAILGAEYILRWVPEGTHQWEKFVTPDELEAAIENSGAHVTRRTGVVYTPFVDRWRLSNDMSVNYMMAAVRED